MSNVNKVKPFVGVYLWSFSGHFWIISVCIDVENSSWTKSGPFMLTLGWERKYCWVVPYLSQKAFHINLFFRPQHKHCLTHICQENLIFNLNTYIWQIEQIHLTIKTYIWVVLCLSQKTSSEIKLYKRSLKAPRKQALRKLYQSSQKASAPKALWKLPESRLSKSSLKTLKKLSQSSQKALSKLSQALGKLSKSRLTFVESSSKAGWILMKALKKST